MIYAGVAELADAPDLGSGGRPWGFESLHPQDKPWNLVFQGFFVVWKYEGKGKF